IQCRQEPMQARIASSRTHAPDYVKSLAPFREKPRYLARVILQVAGHDDSGITGRQLQTGCRGDVASVIATQPRHLHARINAVKVREPRKRIVRAAVLDK